MLFLFLISLKTSFVLLDNYKIAGTPVLTITAKDRDSGDFGTEGIVYQVIMAELIVSENNCISTR